MALIGTAMANHRAGKHIISTRIEHASVYNPLAFLEEQGFEVTYLSVDGDGHISLEELEAAFPGYPIHMDPLSLSVACHIGPGARAVTLTKALPI